MNTHPLSKTAKRLAFLLGLGLMTILVFIVTAPPALASQTTRPPIFPTYGFKLDVPVFEKHGLPGEAVSYDLYLTNAGNVTDSYMISFKSLWEVKTSVTIGPLKPGEQVKDEILVLIPWKIEFGESNQTLIQISSNGNPAIFEIVVFKTTAVNYP